MNSGAKGSGHLLKCTFRVTMCMCKLQDSHGICMEQIRGFLGGDEYIGQSMEM